MNNRAIPETISKSNEPKTFLNPFFAMQQIINKTHPTTYKQPEISLRKSTSGAKVPTKIIAIDIIKAKTKINFDIGVPFIF